MTSRKVTIGYSVGQLGITAFEVFIRIQLLIFYTDVVGLSPSLAGLAVGLAIFWDAITDPMMGWISDRVPAKWGRRQIFFIPGALGAAFCLIALLSPPEAMNQSEKFFFLFMTYLGLNTFSTIFAVPHGALAAELSRDVRERLEVYGWRLAMGNLGAILAAVLPVLSIQIWGEIRFSSIGFVLGLMVLMGATCSFLSTRTLRTDEPRGLNRSTVDWGVWKNRPFLMLLACYLICTIGVSINSVFAIYYYKYRLNFTESQTQSIIAVFIVVFTLSIPLWIVLSRFLSKKISLVVGVLALGVSGSIVYPVFAPSVIAGPLIYAVFAGVMIASVVLLDTFLADVIDYDELKSGEKRAGVYFGIWKLAEKLTRALAIFAGGILLSSAGFVSNQDQSPEVAERIAWIFGPGVNAFFVGGALIALFMNFSLVKHQQVLRLLQKRSRA